MAEQKLVDRIQEERDEIVDLLRHLVELESPSNRKDLVDQVGNFIVEHLKDNGFTPQIENRKEVGNIVWSEWGDTQEGRILFLCHIDTVWDPGSLDKNPFRVENSRIYGPGIFDMKSGVGATLKIQEYLSRGWIQPGKKVRFLYTTDEEITSAESRTLIEDFALQSDVVLVLEPPLPGGGVKTFRKGVGGYLIRIHGKASHSGLNPEEGINAVEELARQILHMHALADSGKGTTVNVNVVRGGMAQNVIAEYAEAAMDFRFREIEEGERVDSAIRSLSPHLSGGRLEIEGGIDRPPMVKSKRSQKLFESAQRIATDLGMKLEEGESGGASDGNITAAAGVPTLDGLGINGNGAHAWHEHVELAAVVPRIALLAGLAERL